ncbi:MAG: hypothetical protein QG608_1181, partial [Actinomycetota bacterium]|nr:hypothetical protein [Actinomycetota bacterium]
GVLVGNCELCTESVRRDGYRAHLATEPETGLITGAEMTMANLDRFHPATSQIAETSASSGLKVYRDSAHGSGEAREAYGQAGRDTVVKPKPVQPAVPGGPTVDALTMGAGLRVGGEDHPVGGDRDKTEPDPGTWLFSDVLKSAGEWRVGCRCPGHGCPCCRSAVGRRGGGRT